MNEQEIKVRFEAIDKRLDELESKNEKKPKQEKSIKEWYKPKSTIEKILMLARENFFNSPRTISEIIEQLKSKDYHLKASDLTLPLRKIVRRNILQRTKKLSDGSTSKSWMYIKCPR